MNEEIFMHRALQLARKALGNTYPNPMVGCVIVHNGKIIGEGWHHRAGEPHAEINALNTVKDFSLLKESQLYVTLEPCSHYGKTPPCALKITELGIPEVIIGSMDPNEKVNGKGKAMLEKAGIRVRTGLLEKECAELNKRFFTFHKLHRPFITLKWAQSADGFLDKDFHPYPITGALAQQWNHKLRASEQAILVGTTTALRDNPSLTVRNYAGNQPIRLIIDRELRIPSDAKIYDGKAPTLILNAQKEEETDTATFIRLDFEQPLIPQILQTCFDRKIQSLIVEGGAQTLGHFLKDGHWDEIHCFEAQNLLLHQGTVAPKVAGTLITETALRTDTLKVYKNTGIGI